MQQDATNHHRKVARTVEREISKSTRVDSAGADFEPVQDAHRRQLRRARHRPRREARRKRIHRSDPRGQVAAHRTHELVHARVRLNIKQLLYGHRADLANPTEVVAHQVDNHEIFGAFLFIREQFVGQCGIHCPVGASRTGSLDWFRGGATV